jgi:hypothetical protein
MSKKNKAFTIFINDLSKAYREFCLNRIMHKEVDSKLYHKFKTTWDTILVGLEKSYFLGLARLFDKYKLRGKEENISIYFFLDYSFIKHDKTIRKLEKLRNKMLVHSDLETMLNLENFLKNLNFKQDRSDIESLFNTTIETADLIKRNFGLRQDLKRHFKKEKESVQKGFDKWFKVFKKRNKISTK